MDGQIIGNPGYLTAGTEKVEIEVSIASKYSLSINCCNGKRITDGSLFSSVVVNIEGEDFKLGPARIIAEPKTFGLSGKLVFTEDIYDLETLFQEKKAIKLQSSFSNLPLVLAQKEKINADFKDFTTDLSYDLSIYKRFFDKADLEFEKEQDNIKESIQKAILDSEGKKFMLYLDQKITELKEVVSSYNKEEHERHGFYFRKQLWDFIMCSPFMRRAVLRPRGYAGDSKMMSMIYKNAYQGNSTFSKVMHKHPIEHPAAQAVRNRRELISNKLKSIGETGKQSGKRITTLSVACGPGYEIRDILLTPKDCDRYHFTLLDQDKNALHEAAELISKKEKRFNNNIKVDYINESVRSILGTPELEKKWGRFDFIYSMGLFDYLTPPVAKSVIHKLFQLLEPGGELIVGNFHVSNPSKIYMEYWLSWVLYHRREDEFRRMLEDVPSATTEILFEDTGSQMFLNVKKKV